MDSDIAAALHPHYSDGPAPIVARRNPIETDRDAMLGYAPDMTFGDDELALLNEAREVEIETQAPGGPVRRTIVWIVVSGEQVFVRSVEGARGHWYRRALENPAVAVHAEGRRVAATAVPADDPASIELVSQALHAKYAGHRASLAAMLQPHNLTTNLRLEPG